MKLHDLTSNIKRIMKTISVLMKEEENSYKIEKKKGLGAGRFDGRLPDALSKKKNIMSQLALLESSLNFLVSDSAKLKRLAQELKAEEEDNSMGDGVRMAKARAKWQEMEKISGHSLL